MDAESVARIYAVLQTRIPETMRIHDLELSHPEDDFFDHFRNILVEPCCTICYYKFQPWRAYRECYSLKFMSSYNSDVKIHQGIICKDRDSCEYRMSVRSDT